MCVCVRWILRLPSIADGARFCRSRTSLLTLVSPVRTLIHSRADVRELCLAVMNDWTLNNFEHEKTKHWLDDPDIRVDPKGVAAVCTPSTPRESACLTGH